MRVCILFCCPQEAVRDADILIFCVPHQFAHAVCKQLRGVTKPGAIAISLTKGMRVRADGPQLISEMVRKSLGCDCSVLMGANIAKDIGSRQLSEATIGCVLCPSLPGCWAYAPGSRERTLDSFPGLCA